MYRLYDSRQTGGVAVDAALTEIGADFEHVVVDIGKGDQFSEDFTRINPRQQVPALQLPDGTVLTEVIAILMHLADTHPEAALAPPAGTFERAQVNRWLSFLATNVYEGEKRRVSPSRYTADPDGEQAVVDSAKDYVARQYEVFEGCLGDGPYVQGDRIGIIDIYLWMLVQWWGDFGWLKRTCPKTLRLVETVMERPRIKPVHLARFGPGLGLD